MALIVSLIIVFIVISFIVYLLIYQKKFTQYSTDFIRGKLREADIEILSVITDKKGYLDKIGYTLEQLSTFYNNVEGACEVKGQAFEYVCSSYDSGETDYRYILFIMSGSLRENNKADQRKSNWFYKRFEGTNKTMMTVKKGALHFGKISGISWKGDSILAQK
jgi:hypothetical protein